MSIRAPFDHTVCEPFFVCLERPTCLLATVTCNKYSRFDRCLAVAVLVVQHVVDKLVAGEAVVRIPCDIFNGSSGGPVLRTQYSSRNTMLGP